MASRSLTERLDHFQRRHHWAGFPLAVLYKFVDDQGIYLAALMTYYGFLSLFPLLLLLTSVLGLLLASDPHLQQQILNTALSKIPVIGDELGQPKRLGGGVKAIVIGSLTALYGSLGVAQALQNAMNQVWAVPRNRRPNPIKSRLRGLLLLLTAGLAVLATTVLSAISNVQSVFGVHLGGVVPYALQLGAVLVNTAVFLLAFRISTAHPFRVREALPGALAAAVLWQLLQTFGAQYVSRVIKDASATNSVSAVVLGLIAFLFLAAIALVLSVEINVVLAKRLWPRSLLTPFVDDVELTHGDKATYSGAAKAQQIKGAQQVDVSFHDGNSRPGVDPDEAVNPKTAEAAPAERSAADR